MQFQFGVFFFKVVTNSQLNCFIADHCSLENESGPKICVAMNRILCIWNCRKTFEKIVSWNDQFVGVLQIEKLKMSFRALSWNVLKRKERKMNGNFPMWGNSLEEVCFRWFSLPKLNWIEHVCQKQTKSGPHFQYIKPLTQFKLGKNRAIKRQCVYYCQTSFAPN